MTTRLHDHADAVAHERIASTCAESAIRIPLLQHALLLGIAADLLLRDPGLSFPICVALVAASYAALAWREARVIEREVVFWLALGVVFASCFAWRASDELQFMNVVASVGSLGMAAVASASPGAALFAKRLRDTVWAAVGAARCVALGFLPVAARAFATRDVRERTTSRVVPALRAAFIAFTILVVFGSLLRGADPLLASLIALPDVDMGELLSHVFVIGLFTWLVGGWARGALAVDVSPTRAPDTLPFRFGALDVNTALGTLIVVFAAYVASQLGWFFGGESFLHERTGLTVATYARQGFFELVTAVALVLPVLVATRAGVPRGSRLAHRHTMLSLPLIAFLGATVISGAARMRLYVHYYGLTTDRLYPFIFMGWLALVLAWFACTVLRDWPRPFVAGTLLSGASMLAALNVANPDLFVARVNLGRAAHSMRTESQLDLGYLATLSGAVPLAVTATLAPINEALPTAGRCQSATELLRRWGPTSSSVVRRENAPAWRGWNADESTAIQSVGARVAALREVVHRACAPFNPRRSVSASPGR